MSEAYGKPVSADNVDHLVAAKLRPLGVLTAADGSSPDQERPDAFLALKLKTKVVPARVVRTICIVFTPLFPAVVVLAVLAGLVAFDVWLFFIHGVGEAMRDTLYSPGLILMLFALVVLAAAFHECGHAAGCAYGGAQPGVMGAGLYFVWPAFYTDVTDSYRLSRGGRLRTDLGGVYFNAVFILATAAVYAVTGFEPLLLVIVVQHLEVLHQLLPFLRLDGYYILADLTGVPDLFTRIKDILRSLIPGRTASERVTILKPWVRVVASVWVLLIVPIIAVNVVFLLVQTPRILATAWDSLGVQWSALGDALGAGKWLDLGAGVVQVVALVLPVAGLVYTFARLGHRLVRGGWHRTDGRPYLRAGFTAGMVAAAGLAAYTWYPDGDYEPLQPAERLTLPEVVGSVAALPTGRPGLTVEREAQLGEVLTVRSGDLAVPSPTAREALIAPEVDSVPSDAPSPSSLPASLPGERSTTTFPASTTTSLDVRQGADPSPSTTASTSTTTASSTSTSTRQSTSTSGPTSTTTALTERGPGG